MSPHSGRSPAKRMAKWSPEENAVITRLRATGMKWDDVSRRIPGRTTLGCRLHYQNYLERRCEWDDERKNKLARLYERFKNEMWQKVGEEMGIPWRAAEGMHWELGKEDMARRAGVNPFTFSSQTDAPQGGDGGSSGGGDGSGPRRSPHHGHSASQGSLPRDLGPPPPNAYGHGGIPTGLPPTTRPLMSRRESLPPAPPSLAPGPGPSRHASYPYPHQHHLPSPSEYHGQQQQHNVFQQLQYQHHHHQQQQQRHHTPHHQYQHQPPPLPLNHQHQHPYPPHPGGGGGGGPPLPPLLQTTPTAGGRPPALPGVAELASAGAGITPYSSGSMSTSSSTSTPTPTWAQQASGASSSVVTSPSDAGTTASSSYHSSPRAYSLGGQGQPPHSNNMLGYEPQSQMRQATPPMGAGGGGQGLRETSPVVCTLGLCEHTKEPSIIIINADQAFRRGRIADREDLTPPPLTPDYPGPSILPTIDESTM
ncbi:hypothetical protein GGR56DRAFT_673204 [Xylariaceae sp. FL0804]|nr:hypothetical protein GGR56DRAFT_673204 [Xylariaceae sp. FL0804]